MLAQLAVDQAAVDMREYVRGFELGQGIVALGLEQQARGHELEQHGDECRRSAMPGDIGQVKGNAPLIDTEVIDKVAR